MSLSKGIKILNLNSSKRMMQASDNASEDTEPEATQTGKEDEGSYLEDILEGKEMSNLKPKSSKGNKHNSKGNKHVLALFDSNLKTGSMFAVEGGSSTAMLTSRACKVKGIFKIKRVTQNSMGPTSTDATLLLLPLIPKKTIGQPYRLVFGKPFIVRASSDWLSIDKTSPITEIEVKHLWATNEYVSY